MPWASEMSEELVLPLVGEEIEIYGVSASRAPIPWTMTFAKSVGDMDPKVKSMERLLVITTPEAAYNLPCSVLLSSRPRFDFARACMRFLPIPGPPVVRYGPRVSIGKGTVIGTVGFGIEWDDKGVPFRVPHFGGVIIGDRTEIGANCTIARGTIENTVIGNDVFIDDQVFIAHNVHVGDRTLIIAKAEVSGSVHIGNDCWIGPSSCIREGIRIGDGAMVGIGAVVVKDVEPGAIVAGNPAKFMRWRRADN